jgi:PAS domain S-box-containing protein
MQQSDFPPDSSFTEQSFTEQSFNEQSLIERHIEPANEAQLSADNDLCALIIEDSLGDAHLLVRVLEGAGFLLDYRIVQSREYLNAALVAESWDVILCDFVMPNLTAADALMLTRARDKHTMRHTPFIVISGLVGEEAAVDIIRAGADDFIAKGNFERLALSIRREVSLLRERHTARTGTGTLNEQIRRAEDALHESEQQYQLLVDNLLEGIIVANADDRILVANPAAERAFGVQPGCLVGCTMDEFIGDDMRDIIAEQNVRRRAGEAGRYEIEITRQNGTKRWQSINATPRFDDHGTFVGAFVIFNDITERKNNDDANVLFSQFLERRIGERTEALKRANAELKYEIQERKRIEEMLLQSGERLNSLLQNSSDVITIVDKNGVISYESPATENVFGFDPFERIGTNFADLIHPSNVETFREMLITLTAQDSTGTQTTEFLYAITPQIIPFKAVADNNENDDKQGKFVWIETTAGNQTHNPAVGGIVLNSRDVSARKVAEQELKRALQQEKELNDLKSRFITMVSHEFRTPLTVMNSSAEILRLGAGRLTPEKHITHIDRIMTAGSRIEEMLNDVLVLARGEAGKTRANFVPLSLDEFCSTIVAELQQATTATASSVSTERRIVYTFSNTASTVPFLDEKLMRSVVTNLLSNALKYSISTVQFDAVCTPETIWLRIEDYGIGIPMEDQKHMFEAFHRAHNALNIKGTGLGMSIVKYAVEAHDGTITFTSVEGRGTVFTVELPFRTSAPVDLPYIA